MGESHIKHGINWEGAHFFPALDAPKNSAISGWLKDSSKNVAKHHPTNAATATCIAKKNEKKGKGIKCEEIQMRTMVA